MSNTLEHPTLPANAVVHVTTSGSARRNDGTRLNPARLNPLLVLATVFTATEGLSDEEKQKENRRIWNGWMFRSINEDTRKQLSNALSIDESSISQLHPEDVRLLESHFSNTFGDIGQQLLHEIGPDVNLSKVYFDIEVNFSGFIFPRKCDFSDSFFNHTVSFEHSTFGGSANLEGVYFNGSVNFSNATFHSPAIITSAVIEGGASFKHASFKGPAFFDNAKFKSGSTFDEAKFHLYAGFSDISIERNGARFLGTKFISIGPNFFGANLHPDTRFSEEKSLWPKPDKEHAVFSKRSYARLRQFATEYHDLDLEYFFMRQEMACKEVLAHPADRLFFAFYRIFSDFGFSVGRPLLALFLVVLVGWAVIGMFFSSLSDIEPNRPIFEALGLSFSNTVPFLGFVDSMYPDFHAAAPMWIDLFSACQSVLGLIFFFLLGIGLRNRFRLR